MTKTCEAADCFDDDDGCANCNDEGYTEGDCGWGWQCPTYDEGEGNCLCQRRCDWCNPVKPTQDSEALLQILADALNQPKDSQ